MALPTAQPGEDAAEVHGLFVGVDRYDSARRIDLDGCANDARFLSQAAAPALTSNVVLTDGDADRSSILGRIEETIDKCAAGDLFVFFCACHGVARYGEFFMLPADHDPRAFLGTTLHFQDVANAVGSKEGVNNLIVIDACQSGAIGFDPAAHNRGQRSSIMMASAPLEVSQEEEFEDVGRAHGVFAYSLIRQLDHVFSKGGPGSATVGEIFNGAYTRTKDLTKNQQHPIMVGTLPASLKVSRR